MGASATNRATPTSSRRRAGNYRRRRLLSQKPLEIGLVIESYGVLTRMTDLYWVLLGFTGFYLVLLGFTGFYWVLLGCTGFYLVSRRSVDTSDGCAEGSTGQRRQQLRSSGEPRAATKHDRPDELVIRFCFVFFLLFVFFFASFSFARKISSKNLKKRRKNPMGSSARVVFFLPKFFFLFCDQIFDFEDAWGGGGG